MKPEPTPRLVAVGVALPTVWFGLLAASYALVPVACAWGSRAPLHGAFGAALAATVALAALAVVPSGPAGAGAGAGAWSRWSTMRRAVCVEAALFVVAVLLLGLANLVVDPCA